MVSGAEAERQELGDAGRSPRLCLPHVQMHSGRLVAFGALGTCPAAQQPGWKRGTLLGFWPDPGPPQWPVWPLLLPFLNMPLGWVTQQNHVGRGGSGSLLKTEWGDVARKGKARVGQMALGSPPRLPPALLGHCRECRMAGKGAWEARSGILALNRAADAAC